MLQMELMASPEIATVVAKSEGMFDKAVFDSGIAPQETAAAQAYKGVCE